MSVTERPLTDAVHSSELGAVLAAAADRSARYGVYILAECYNCGGADTTHWPGGICAVCRGQGRAPHRVAECERDAIGTTLVTLADDRRAAGEPTAEVFGVLDQERRQWISGLWPSVPR